MSKKLSKELTYEYGKGFDETSLYWFVRFYKGFPEIFDTACKKSVLRLSWSHFWTLLQVEDSSARAWYMQEAISQTWSVRTLQRNISSQYYVGRFINVTTEVIAQIYCALSRRIWLCQKCQAPTWNLRFYLTHNTTITVTNLMVTIW